MMKARGWVQASGSAYDSVLTKPVQHGWQLELRFRLGEKNRALISSAYAQVRDDGQRYAQSDWEWADTFGNDVQFARRGALYTAQLSPEGALQHKDLIKDLTDMTFEAIEPPYTGIAQP
jgi:hypothetical protein